MPRPSAHIQEVTCPGVAWKACAAWNTMATELVKPTSTATKPAVKADRLRSLKNCMGRFWHCTGVVHDRLALALKKERQISIFEPSSTTALLGRCRKSAAPLALWCIWAKSFSRQGAMPLPMVGTTVSRERK